MSSSQSSDRFANIDLSQNAINLGREDEKKKKSIGKIDVMVNLSN